MDLKETLLYIRKHSEFYNKFYCKRVLEWDDQYIQENLEYIRNDCWITLRMLLNVLNQGDIPIEVSVIHIENPFFRGYHDFLLIGDYLVDSYCDKYVMRISKLQNKDKFKQWLEKFRASDLKSRQKDFTELFTYEKIDRSIKPEDIRIVIIKYALKYNFKSVKEFAVLKDITKIELLNI